MGYIFNDIRIVIGLILIISIVVGSLLNTYFSVTRHSLKTTRAKVLKKHTFIWYKWYKLRHKAGDEFVTFLFPNKKKYKLLVEKAHCDSINTGDIVDVKHKGIDVLSVKNIIVSTTKVKIIKKHHFPLYLTSIQGYQKVSVLFLDKKTREMVVPFKFSNKVKIDDIVMITHRGGLVESLKKESSKLKPVPVKTQAKFSAM